MEEKLFTYSEVEFAIKEKYGSIQNLADKMGVTRTNVYNRMHTRTDKFITELKEVWKVNIRHLNQTTNIMQEIKNVKGNKDSISNFHSKEVTINDSTDIAYLRFRLDQIDNSINIISMSLQKHENDISENGRKTEFLKEEIKKVEKKLK